MQDIFYKNLIFFSLKLETPSFIHDVQVFAISEAGLDKSKVRNTIDLLHDFHDNIRNKFFYSLKNHSLEQPPQGGSRDIITGSF